MPTTTKTMLEFDEIKPYIGARVRNSKHDLLGGALAGEIMDLPEQRGVLVFPRICFTDEEHVSFTHTLGRFVYELRGEEIYKVSLDTGENATAEYLKAAFFWHFDGFMSPMPDPREPTGRQGSFGTGHRRYRVCEYLRRLRSFA